MHFVLNIVTVQECILSEYHGFTQSASVCKLITCGFEMFCIHVREYPETFVNVVSMQCVCVCVCVLSLIHI